MSDTYGVVLGISGSISAYKSLDVIRLLRRHNVRITPILSPNAHRFVTPWCVETLSESPIHHDGVSNGQIDHLAHSKANVFVVCPASANTLSKLAHGRCDDALSASFLNFEGPKIVFPAMHTTMYTNPITQANIATLQRNGVIVIDPDTGDLACGDVGDGRLPHPSCIVDVTMAHAQASLNFNGKHCVITCGGTVVPIDPVRVLSNRASGQSGHVLANVLVGFGARVTLIRPVTHPTLRRVSCVFAPTVLDMDQACQAQQSDCDVFIMNAAVSDFTVPRHQKKHPRHAPLSLTFTPTTDILASFNEHAPDHCVSVGYCLSDQPNLVDIAIKKRHQKKCTLMVANHPDAIGANQRTITLINQQDASTTVSGSLQTIAVHVSRMIAEAIPTRAKSN